MHILTRSLYTLDMAETQELGPRPRQHVVERTENREIRFATAAYRPNAVKVYTGLKSVYSKQPIYSPFVNIFIHLIFLVFLCAVDTLSVTDCNPNNKIITGAGLSPWK